MVSLAVAVLAMSGASPFAEMPRATPVAFSPETETAVVQSARGWLALGDASKWAEAWQATGASFRRQNTVEQWQAAAIEVRLPLGVVLSRTPISAEDVPTPPNGNAVVKFRTRFANRADVVETVALAREDGSWKVVGCYIE